MTKDEIAAAKKMLEKYLPEMAAQGELHDELEQVLCDHDGDSSLVCGPRNELEYRRMLKELKESENGK